MTIMTILTQIDTGVAQAVYLTSRHHSRIRVIDLVVVVNL